MVCGQRISVSARKLIVLALGVIVGLTGCGAQDESSGREQTDITMAPKASPSDELSVDNPDETPTPNAREIAEKSAKAAYLAMWDDLLAAGLTSDWDSPRLDDHATDAALAELRRRLRADHDKGLVSKGKFAMIAVVKQTSVGNPRYLAIDDCFDDKNWLSYKADTGEQVDNGPRGRHSATATAALQDDGTWKIRRFTLDEVGTC